MGLTQEGIAAEVGITQPSVSALATGKVSNPSFDVGSKLMKLHAKTSRKWNRARRADEPKAA